MALSPERQRPSYLKVVPREPDVPAPEPRFRGSLWLGFGVAAGPLAWLLSYVVAGQVVASACSTGGVGLRGTIGGQVVSIVVSATAAVVAGGTGLVSYQILGREMGTQSEPSWGWIGQRAFWALGGVIVSGAFLVAILATSLALFISGLGCARP